MAGKKFDPWHEWLGIPPEAQPPNHYQLLGVREWEDNPSVIENAADGRMLLLRSFQSGARGSIADKLLTHVANAKVVLLNPEKKQAYDQRLRKELQSAQGSNEQGSNEQGSKEPTTNASVGAATERPQDMFPQVSVQTRTKDSPAKARQRGKKSTLAPLLALGGLAVVLCVVVGLILAQGLHSSDEQNGSQVASGPNSNGSSEASPDQAANHQAGQPDAPSSDGSPPTTDKPNPDAASDSTSSPADGQSPANQDAAHQDAANQNSADATPPNANSINASGTDSSNPAAASSDAGDPKRTYPDSADPDSANPDSANPGAASQNGKPVSPASIDSPKRLAPPDEAQQAALRKSLAEQFEIDKLRDPVAKLKLMPALSSMAIQATDPHEKFAIMRFAADLALEGNSPAMALEIIERLSREYDIEGRAEKLAALERIETPLKAVNVQVATLALSMVEGAIRDEDIAQADRLSVLAASSAARARDRELRARTRDVRKTVQEVQAEFENVEAARTTLEAAADDAAAHQTVGLWECVRRGDWELGVKHLAQAAPGALRDAAAADLKGASDASGEAAIGDLWWEIAETNTEHGSGLRQRALHWYRRASLQLPAIAQRRTLNRLRESPVKLEHVIRFDGRTTRLFTPHIAFDVGPQFTIEFWLRDWTGMLAMAGNQGDPENGIEIMHQKEGGLFFWEHGKGSNRLYKFDWPHGAGRFEHLAICYDRGALRIFRDGRIVRQAAKVVPGLLHKDRPFDIGFGNRGRKRPDRGTGEIGLIRISNIARYQQPFMPETSWLADANTLLLLNGSQSGGRMIDYSSKANHATPENLVIEPSAEF